MIFTLKPVVTGSDRGDGDGRWRCLHVIVGAVQVDLRRWMGARTFCSVGLFARESKAVGRQRLQCLLAFFRVGEAHLRENNGQ